MTASNHTTNRPAATLQQIIDASKKLNTSAVDCANAMQALGRRTMFQGEAAVAVNDLTPEQQEQVYRATSRVMAAVTPVQPDALFRVDSMSALICRSALTSIV